MAKNVPRMANSPQQLINNINDSLFNFLREDFKDYLFEEESKMVHKVVYSYKASEKALQTRRKDNGGLSDINNMDIVTYPNEGAILFVNNTPPQKTEMRNDRLTEAEAVETGDSNWNQSIPGARPFTQDTVYQIAKSRGTYSLFKNYYNGKTIQIK